MSAGNRKRRKTAEYTIPGYVFQGMALTYNRIPAMMQRRLTRTPQPIRQAVKSIQQRSARRVQFAPSIQGRPASIPEISEDPLTTPSVPAESQETPSVPDEYAYKERLPQSFPHGLPPSSLEPGTSDQQYPPSQLFPEPPMGDNQELLMETPLQAVAHIKGATRNIQQLVGELAASLWRKAKNQERHFPQQHFPP